MSFRLPLTAEKVYLRAGVYTQTFALSGQVRPGRPWDRLTQFGLLLCWPKTVSWLRVFGSADSGGGGPNTPLSNTASGLDAVCAAHACRREQVAPARFLEVHSFLTASLPQSNRMFLTIEVDTDHDDFRRAVRERRNKEKAEFVLTLRLVFFDAKQLGNYIQQEGLIELVLKPCAAVPRFVGVLAIDLGNTSTSSAALAESDPVYKSASVKLVSLDVDAELGGEPRPLPSILRLDRINSAVDVPEGMRRFPALPGDDRPNSVEFIAGELATAGSVDGELPSGVVFSAKHLLNAKSLAPDNPADMPGETREATISLVVSHARPHTVPQIETVEVLSRLPAELLFTHAVRSFRRAASSWPPDLVITYPTTYSPRELHHLTQAAARGWLRAVSQPQDSLSVVEPNEDPQLEQLSMAVRDWLANPAGSCPLIGLTLDEATAAAFFHLYRKVFEQPGGIVRFRYLYPDGLRLLLIDCGGGTTDVALVHAISRPTSPTLVEIDVLARTGSRGFGGDSITRSLCRLVKAKLQILIARTRPGSAGSLSPLPVVGPSNLRQAAEVVSGFIQKAALLDPSDELVPTKFNNRGSDPLSLRRRTCFQGLWQLAEAIKFGLARGRPLKLKEISPALIGRDTSPLIASMVKPVSQQLQQQILSQISELTFSPWEVDAMIREPVEKVMKKCTRLIDRLLIRNPAGEREVDWVVISGNGSRYPLIKRLAEEMLTVARPEDCISLDPDNLKNAVVKGAAMARMVERIPRTLGIKFNRHLSELLPFDVGYHNMITNSTELLFKEYTPYSELAMSCKRVKLVAPGELPGDFGNTFVLERRFPGDDAYEQYAAYRFPLGISVGGELEVKYDSTAGEFHVSDCGSGQVGELTDLAEQEQKLIVMRGDI